MSSMSMWSSSSLAYPPDHISSSDQLCYVHCRFCDTVLAVSVPPSSLLKTVTVRCGHCSNLLSVTVNMRSLLLPSAHSFLLPPNLLQEELQNKNMSHHTAANGSVDLPPPIRPQEKRQRVPSAYNRFIKEEIQRIKAGNPLITHREAFSAAAKNWAHFPRIYYGLMADNHPTKKAHVHQEDGEDVMIGREGFYGSVNNIGLTHN